MKRVVVVLMCLYFATTGFATIIVYENDYQGETPGNGFPAWNWIDGDTSAGFVKSHTATYVDDGGNILVNHIGHIDNSLGTTAVNTRFGSKWTITMNGLNTSTDPADYTIEFDLHSVSGNWDPIALEFFVLTGTGNGVGKGSGASNYAFADGVVHVSKTLDQLPVGWWNGTGWVLTDTTWQLELGGPPWPGTSVPAGTPAFDQVWTFDNLKITMIPEPATLALLGLGSLALLRRRK